MEEATNRGEGKGERNFPVCTLFCAGRKAVLKGALCAVFKLSINLNFAHYPWICSKTDSRIRVPFFQTQLSRAHIPSLNHPLFGVQILLYYQCCMTNCPQNLMLKATVSICLYYHIVSVGLDFGSGLGGWFWLRVSFTRWQSRCQLGLQSSAGLARVRGSTNMAGKMVGLIGSMPEFLARCPLQGAAWVSSCYGNWLLSK